MINVNPSAVEGSRKAGLAMQIQPQISTKHPPTVIAAQAATQCLFDKVMN